MMYPLFQLVGFWPGLHIYGSTGIQSCSVCKCSLVFRVQTGKTGNRKTGDLRERYLSRPRWIGNELDTLNWSLG